MNEFSVKVSWQVGDHDFLGRSYSRAHKWLFDGGAEVAATASHHIVPLPYAVPEFVDPEEAFVAALASCHMLFFLDFASREGIDVTSYTDSAVGTLAVNDSGKQAMTRVVLNPRVEIAGDITPDPALLARLHHKSHEHCFIANSVITEIEVRC